MLGPKTPLVWRLSATEPRQYQCGWCGRHVGSIQGETAESVSIRSRVTDQRVDINICPICSMPSVYRAFPPRQVPAVPFGEQIPNLPQEVAEVYEEARLVMAVGAFNATALLCRKELMHIAVMHGADEGLRFNQYVKYLGEKYLTNPNMVWVDRIREGGNDATHKMAGVSEEKARDLMKFTSMLLRLIYEFPKE